MGRRFISSSKIVRRKGDLALEEERRLAYVGITRAKKESFISFVMNRMYRGDWVDSLASRFIGELPEKNIKKEEITEQIMKISFLIKI